MFTALGAFPHPGRIFSGFKTASVATSTCEKVWEGVKDPGATTLHIQSGSVCGNVYLSLFLSFSYHLNNLKKRSCHGNLKKTTNAFQMASAAIG